MMHILGTDYGPWMSSQTYGNKMLGCPVCPDLLSIDDIGVADNLRGKVVRGFFLLIGWWKP